MSLQKAETSRENLIKIHKYGPQLDSGGWFFLFSVTFSNLFFF